MKSSNVAELIRKELNIDVLGVGTPFDRQEPSSRMFLIVALTHNRPTIGCLKRVRVAIQKAAEAYGEKTDAVTTEGLIKRIVASYFEMGAGTFRNAAIEYA